MCHGCWVEYGQPQIDSSAVREAARAIAAVYDFSCVGGDLHIVIDDWNLEDDNLEWCAGEIDKNEFHASTEQLASERLCLDLLRPLSEDERASALALYDRFWKPDGEVIFDPPEPPMAPPPTIRQTPGGLYIVGGD
jgi:hypothetical protein